MPKGAVTAADAGTMCDAGVRSFPDRRQHFPSFPPVSSFARQVDVETSPDADTPRPCGVALLECMLERETESVSSALVEAAGQLQVSGCGQVVCSMAGPGCKEGDGSPSHEVDRRRLPRPRALACLEKAWGRKPSSHAVQRSLRHCPRRSAVLQDALPLHLTIAPAPQSPHPCPQTAPLTRETLLLREATYRALGECFSHVRTKVDFPNWYETELRGILQPTPNAGERMQIKVLLPDVVLQVSVASDLSACLGLRRAH